MCEVWLNRPLVSYSSILTFRSMHTIGDEEGRHRREHVEELELEIRGRPPAERCLLHSLRCWGLCELLTSLQPRRQVLLNGRHHHFRSWRPQLSQGFCLLKHERILSKQDFIQQCLNSVFFFFFLVFFHFLFTTRSVISVFTILNLPLLSTVISVRSRREALLISSSLLRILQVCLGSYMALGAIDLIFLLYFLLSSRYMCVIDFDWVLL